MRFKHEVRELINFAATLGYAAQRSNGGHVALERNGQKVFVPSTPSDRRWIRNARALLIRKLKMEPNDGIVIKEIGFCRIPELSRQIDDYRAQGLADELISSLVREHIDTLRRQKRIMPKKILLQRNGWSESTLRDLLNPVFRCLYERTQPGGSTYQWTDFYFATEDILYAERLPEFRSEEQPAEILTYHAEAPEVPNVPPQPPQDVSSIPDPMSALAARIKSKVQEFEEALLADIPIKSKEFETKLWADAFKSIG